MSRPKCTCIYCTTEEDGPRFILRISGVAPPSYFDPRIGYPFRTYRDCAPSVGETHATQAVALIAEPTNECSKET